MKNDKFEKIISSLDHQLKSNDMVSCEMVDKMVDGETDIIINIFHLTTYHLIEIITNEGGDDKRKGGEISNYFKLFINQI